LEREKDEKICFIIEKYINPLPFLIQLTLLGKLCPVSKYYFFGGAKDEKASV
jgi:hypothetical protein